MQDTGTARERKLAKGSVLEGKPPAANSVSESSDKVPWEQSTSKTKENLNNLDTKALGREVISSCASGYVTVPAITLRGVVVVILAPTINANSDELENGCHLKRVEDTEDGSSKHG